MKSSFATRCAIAGWVLLVGSYLVAALTLSDGPTLTTFGDIAQCFAPLLANLGLLLNASSTHWRKNAFWMLLAMGCTMWMLGQFMWVYFELYLHVTVPNPFAGDVIFFLHVVPMIAALTLQPHLRQADRHLRYGFLDFSLLMLWWVYLYVFAVIPWQYVTPNLEFYGNSFNRLYFLENAVLVVGLAVLWSQSRGVWRRVYTLLFAAASVYLVGSSSINFLIDLKKYYTGSIYDIPLISSFPLFGTAGLYAFLHSADKEALPVPQKADNLWPARLAMMAVITLPLFAIWSVVWSQAPDAVRNFRLAVTLGTMLPLNFLVSWRQHLVNRERLGLLHASQESVENLRRLQTQYVQAEKLTSLGQLAAGAAHEINNPLTAILGYSDLMLSDASLPGRPRGLSEKIRAQAERTKKLVTSLLSFARQVPAEKILLDLNPILSSAVQLRSLDLRDKNVSIELDTESVLPGVRGDPNQLLQVFFNVISNAVDAMEEIGGGVLTVRTSRDRTNAVIEFADTGPGIKEPGRVFDPFYTTKPVGKGTGLGLSICYGIIREHGGQITCRNQPDGGAAFRIELPVLPVHFPQPVAAFLPTTKSA
jgi:signal transduction histidine kinase